MNPDEKWMRFALDLARKGLGRTSPNPCVGAVIVKNGKLLGQGWHKQAGKAHSEIEAIRDARRRGHRIQGSTLYVTLEPCCTHGRTPPCTEALIHEKFKRVVVGATDPNPAHAGRAFRILRKACIQVEHGILKAECTHLNRAFNHWITTGKPWVLAKAALTLDGKLALPKFKGKAKRRWISSPASRKDAHRLRSFSDAILIGAQTARIDNPRLTVRGIRGAKQPWRVVITRSGKLPKSLHLFSDRHKSRTLVYRSQSWLQILQDLGKRGVLQLLVEGGGEIHSQLARKRLVNEIVLYYASLVVGKPAGNLPHDDALRRLPLKQTTLQRLGPDLKLQGLV